MVLRTAIVIAIDNTLIRCEGRRDWLRGACALRDLVRWRYRMLQGVSARVSRGRGNEFVARLLDVDVGRVGRLAGLLFGARKLSALGEECVQGAQLPRVA